MSCSVAVASSSPVFSPSRVSSSLFCKTSASLTSPVSPSSSLSFSHRLHQTFTIPCRDNNNTCSTSAAPVHKRKRPAMLNIPITSFSFSPAPSVSADVLEDERDGFAVCCKRGKKAAMEDRYSAAVHIHGDPKQAFFGVFDGHGGAQAAEFASKNLERNIFDEVLRRDDENVLEDAVKHGYLNTDAEFLRKDFRGGSCCVTAFTRNGNLVVSNAGDCRAVMSRGGVAVALTSDHRPSREDEKDRIESLGGYVDDFHGVCRLQGTLAVSRGIGDRHLKQWVLAEPETNILTIKPECEFLILGSDGLWDKVNNQEAVDIARPLCVDISKPELLLACKKLVDLSMSRGSADDTSVMLIPLGRFI